MREAPQDFVERLQRYDDALRVVWCDQLNGKPVNRWRILRKSPSGVLRHIMFVCGPQKVIVPGEPVSKFGVYIELGDHVLEALHRCDSWRFGRLNARAWDEGGRREFMNSLGMREGEDDAFVEAAEAVEAKRYHTWAEELGERIQFARRQDPEAFPDPLDKAEQIKAEARAEASAEVREAQRVGKGVIAYDPKIEGPRVVS